MGYIDLILTVIIIVIGLRGFYNGFINEISGVIGIILGVFFASRFAGRMGDWFSSDVYNFHSPSVASLIGFVIILAVIWIAFLILGIIISKFIKISDFGIIDKTLGFIFSCCKIFLIIGFILYGISNLNFMKDFQKYMKQNSKIYTIMNTISSSIMKLQIVQETTNNIKNTTQPAADAAIENLQKAVNEAGPNISDTINNSLKDISKDIPPQTHDKTDTHKE
ncbi:CvpA family protein [Helicobacter sp. 11S03491-1]|uniref:CvpA family protein n=1 Tax=Helicobacter sp. 11S03491-1 TaxID=1476196 RepID=UPI000BA75B82|nr:CvpA family protein [Helicobacter sp. 11S03491-1]PAF41588.1 hypothetical protein BKH45_06725 [Helicobacter sp. 11S03491-1]